MMTRTGHCAVLLGTIFFLAMKAGDVTAVECYSCYHEENMNLLNVKEEDLDGVVYQAYRDYYDSVTHQISGSTIKFTLDITVDKGEACVDKADTLDPFTCGTFPSGVVDNTQHCGTVFVETKTGGRAWARGCIAQELCERHSQTVESGDSRLELKCCNDGNNCNDKSWKLNGGSVTVVSCFTVISVFCAVLLL